MKYSALTWQNKAAQTLLPSILLMLIGAASAAGSVHAAPTSESDKPSFVKYDTNQDGFVSLEESKTRGMQMKAFEEADLNRDGKLTKEEFVKAASIDGRVKVTEFVDDSVVTAKVKTSLLKNSLLKGMQVHVETNKGTVQLSGFADNDRQIATAAQIAAGVEGVNKVVNDLVVKK